MLQSLRMKNLRRSIFVLSLLFFLDTIPSTRGDDAKASFQDDDIPIFDTNPPTVTPTFQPSLSPSSAHPTKSHVPTKTPVSTPSYFPSTVNGVLITSLPSFQMNVFYTTKKKFNNAASSSLLLESLSSYLDSHIRNQLNLSSASIEEQLIGPLFLRYSAYDESSQGFVECSQDSSDSLCRSIVVSAEAEFIQTPSLRKAMDEYVALFNFYTVNALDGTSSSAVNGKDANHQTFLMFLQDNDGLDEPINGIANFEFLFSEEPFNPFKVSDADLMLEELYAFEPYREKTFDEAVFNGPMVILFLSTILCLLGGTYLIVGHAWYIYRQKKIVEQP